MIFGDPYRFAIWIECIPQWSSSYKNGFFYFFVNGNMYPDDIRTSTLDVDINDIMDDNNAFIAFPYNDEIFNLPTNEAFSTLFNLAYPEPMDDNDYPVQEFKYCVSPTIINDSGAYFFAIFNVDSVRIIGGKTMQLIDNENGRCWAHIDMPQIEDVTIPKHEIREIILNLKKHSLSL